MFISASYKSMFGSCMFILICEKLSNPGLLLIFAPVYISGECEICPKGYVFFLGFFCIFFLFFFANPPEAAVYAFSDLKISDLKFQSQVPFVPAVLT